MKEETPSVLGIRPCTTEINNKEIKGYAIRGIGLKYQECWDFINGLSQNEVICLFSDFPWSGIAFTSPNTEDEFIKIYSEYFFD